MECPGVMKALTLALAAVVVFASTAAAAPTPKFTYKPARPEVGQLVVFKPTGTRCGHRPCSYTWRSIHSILHHGKVLRTSFARPGVKKIRLIVRNRDGVSATRTRRLRVGGGVPTEPVPPGGGSSSGKLPPADCSASQGSESLASFVSSHGAGRLCLRTGTQVTHSKVNLKSGQLLRGVGPSTVVGDFGFADNSGVENFRVEGCYQAPGCNTGSDKTLEINDNDVRVAFMDVTSEGGRNGPNNIQCILISDAKVTGLVVEYSRLHGCGQESAGNHMHGIYCASAAGPRFIGNWLYDNEGWGLHIYPDCDDAVLEGNVSAMNGQACVTSGEGSAASDRARWSKGFCGFARETNGSAAPMSCYHGGNGTLTDMTLYDPDSGPFESTCGSWSLGNTFVGDPQFRDRAGYDFRAQAPETRQRMGTFADNVPGPQ